MEAKKDPKYYNTDKLPLLMQGFDIQSTSLFLGILEDRKEFQLKVDRGVVNYLDACVSFDVSVAFGLQELQYNGSQITLLAGGQQLLVDEPSTRYLFNADLGDKSEQKVPVIINGGQTLTSRFFLPDITSNLVSNFAQCQIQAYYTTKRHEEFLKNEARFYFGLGLKRQTFRVKILAGMPVPSTLEAVIPSNQGKIVGFSVLGMGGDDTNSLAIDVGFDDLQVISNVWLPRFAKSNQRDPFILWIALNPGSTLQLTLKRITPATVLVGDSFAYLTLYFAN